MKINGTLSLMAIGIALASTTTWAQTTPTGTVSSSSIPQGAVAPDSAPAKAAARNQKRAMRQARRSMNQNSTNGTGNTTAQDAQYRQSSTSDGTAINNSNTTNYNSNNVTNAPTGAGSNPNTMTNSGNTTTSAPTNSNRSSMNPTDSNAGTVEAVKGARTTETPAVKAGSTVRNSSVGDFIGSSPNYITLQNALQSSDLYEMLKGSGPYTLFAPTNSAFKKLPANVQAGLLDGSHRDALKQLLSYHIVSGALNSDDLGQQIKAGNGKAQLKTLSGGTLTAAMGANGKLSLTDEQGNTVHVEGSGNRQANGMVYGIDNVLMSKTGASSFR
ncbi:fasciclin domain-containing protein [Spirosoma aerolatum]|uniref:fasciclin domain-containing protein n=1 Tax=Spirosoma aerolatum TaxID=1211326 RepID=UPI0009AF02B8|nr:fasciclin domain-containing protein [Spirosoma aerolatum]